jgi:hypothetical protein|eukprot:COSAG02_NODE_1187_length_14003_cov_48.566240_9_plen_49_part_00
MVACGMPVALILPTGPSVMATENAVRGRNRALVVVATQASANALMQLC